MEDLLDKKGKSLIARIADLLLVLVILLLLFVIILTSIYRICLVDGESMLDTIHDEDLVLCSSPSDLSRGDIVVATASEGGKSGEKSIIKRIVACPGDKIVFIKETFNVASNGWMQVKLYLCQAGESEFVKQDEPFIRNNLMTAEGFSRQTMFDKGIYNLYDGKIEDLMNLTEEGQNEYVITMGEDEYFLMGDNRENSKDSRSYGTFNKTEITGKCVTKMHSGVVYWTLWALHKLRWFN